MSMHYDPGPEPPPPPPPLPPPAQQTPWTAAPYVVPAHLMQRPGSVVAASLLTGVAGAFWLLVSLIQFGAFVIDSTKPEVAMTAIWNSVLVGLYVWIAWGLWHGSHKALSWACGTHFLNAALCLYQGLTDAPLVVLVVPIHILGGVAAMMVKPTPQPGKTQT